MPDPTVMKLGKLAKKFDPRMRAFAPISHQLPPAPAAVDWTTKALPNYGMMLNDSLGCCTAAAKGHAIQTWTSLTRPAEITVPDAVILDLYEKSSGYNPADPSTDQGAAMVDVINYWLKNPIAGNELSAAASVAPGSRTDVMAGIWMFGGIDIGIQLPISAQRQEIWDVPAGGPKGDGAPGSWGGHDVFVAAYDAVGLTCITWGALKKMTWAMWDAYADEAYVYLSPDWFQTVQTSPPDFDLQELQDYLNAFHKL